MRTTEASSVGAGTTRFTQYGKHKQLRLLSKAFVRHAPADIMAAFLPSPLPGAKAMTAANRRTFLKGAGALAAYTAAGAAASENQSSDKPASKSEPRRVTIGVIGVGGM